MRLESCFRESEVQRFLLKLSGLAELISDCVGVFSVLEASLVEAERDCGRRD